MTEMLSKTTAPLQNVSLCAEALERTTQREGHLPGMVCFYGPSGLGKSTAAAYVSNKYKAYYVEAKSSWTKKKFVHAILIEMGVSPLNTVYDMVDQVSEQLILSQRPLIIDQMDYMVERNLVEIIRDLYDNSNAAILLIGEEGMPVKLKAWERFHNRILDFVPAQPADMEDTLHLRNLYCPDVEIDIGLLEMIREKSKGCVSRICINLDRIRKEAKTDGQNIANVSWWGHRTLFTGDAPARRV